MDLFVSKLPFVLCVFVASFAVQKHGKEWEKGEQDWPVIGVA